MHLDYPLDVASLDMLRLIRCNNYPLHLTGRYTLPTTYGISDVIISPPLNTTLQAVAFRLSLKKTHRALTRHIHHHPVNLILHLTVTSFTRYVYQASRIRYISPAIITPLHLRS